MMSFVATGIAGQDEANFVSAMFALLFLISLVAMFFKWLVGVAKKHPEWMMDDEYVTSAPSQKNKTPKSVAPIKKTTTHTSPKKTKTVFAENNIATTTEISSFVAIGKSNGEAIRFDIKPDREIEIEYQDASGEITRRRITAQVIETAWGGLVIKAYCHLRQSQRSFKIENIHRLYENGREINIVDWLGKIGFSQNRRVKKRIVKKKISDMVDKMSNSALDDFIKNSD